MSDIYEKSQNDDDIFSVLSGLFAAPSVEELTEQAKKFIEEIQTDEFKADIEKGVNSFKELAKRGISTDDKVRGSDPVLYAGLLADKLNREGRDASSVTKKDVIEIAEKIYFSALASSWLEYVNDGYVSIVDSPEEADFQFGELNFKINSVEENVNQGIVKANITIKQYQTADFAAWYESLPDGE